MKERWLRLRFLVGASRRYAWSLLKSCIGFVAGRDFRFNERDLFLRQCIPHLMGIRAIRKITCTGINDEGACSQALMMTDAINFARFFGLTYEHTAFRVIEHAERPMDEWVKSWETLFHLGEGETVCDGQRHDVVEFSHNFNDLDMCFGWRRRWDELAERFKEMIPELQRKYYLQRVPRTSEEVTVAVHIRRGDVSSDDPDYFTGNETILRTIASVMAILEARELRHKIRVYSQGSHSGFADFSLPGVDLFLDADAIWTLRELIEADVLIMAKGWFSHYAGLISDGVKIFEPVAQTGTGHLPSWKWRSVPLTESWIPCKADGTFDSAAAEFQILRVVRAKATSAVQHQNQPR